MAAISKTLIQIKLGKKSEVHQFIEQRIELISSIDGLKNWGFMYTGETEITIIAVYENKTSAENATPQVNTILGELGSLLASPPVREIFEAYWY